MTAQEKIDKSLYNHDSEQVRNRIRQLMKEMGVKEYVETKRAAFADATR